MFFNRNSDMYIEGSRGQGVKGASEKPSNPRTLESSNSKLIIITDGGHKTGMGHIMRCLSLAKVLIGQGVETVFYSNGEIARQKIKSERFKIIDDIDEKTPDVLFIDLPPHLSRSSYIDRARERGIISIAFDDMLINGEKADVIINPSIIKGQGSRVRGQDKNILAPCPLPLAPFVHSGAEYAVINDSFVNIKQRTKEIRKKGRNVLITMGGSDPSMQTERILESLLNLNLNLEVVIGMAYKKVSRVKPAPASSKQGSQGSRVVIHNNVKNMAELMIKADMAFVAGGITLYEAAFVGLPVIVIAQDKYQALTAGEFHKKGFGVYLGMFNEVSGDLLKNECIGLLDDYNRCKKMSGIGKRLVDGKGVFRVAEIIKDRVQGFKGLRVRVKN